MSLGNWSRMGPFLFHDSIDNSMSVLNDVVLQVNQKQDQLFVRYNHRQHHSKVTYREG